MTAVAAKAKPRFAAGTYITDGTRLLYIMSWPKSGRVTCEDCATEAVVEVPAELIRAEWRKVERGS